MAEEQTIYEKLQGCISDPQEYARLLAQILVDLDNRLKALEAQ